MNKKRKPVLIRTAVGLLLLFALLWAGYQMYVRLMETEEAHVVFVPESLEKIIGYGMDGDSFVAEGEDPQFFLPVLDGTVQKVQIQFAQPLEEDMQIEVYYAENYRFKQENMILATVKAGSVSFTADIHGRKMNTVRCDLNGNFHLAQITCDYVIANRQPVLFVVCMGAAFLLFAALYLGTAKIPFMARLYRYSAQEFCDRLRQSAAGQWIQTKLTVQRYFLVVGTVMGIAMAFLIPSYQIPDEYTHLVFMQEELGLEGYAENAIERYFNPISASQVQGRSAVRQDFDTYVKFASVPFDDSLSVSFKPNLKVLRHLPANIGFMIAVLLHLPIYWCLQISELCALACYLGIGWLALKYMPMKKNLLAFVMLLPMALQQAGSINYDIVLLPVCFFLVAYVYYLAYQKEEIRWKDMGLLALTLLVIVVTKAPYALIVLLMFIIPHKKYRLMLGKWDVADWCYRRRYVILVLGALLCVAGVYVMRDSSYVKIVLASLLDIPHLIYMLFTTGIELGGFYIVSTVGCFGWLDSHVARWFIVLSVLVFFALVFQSNPEKVVIGKRTRIISLGIFFSMVLLIFMSMISWTVILAGVDRSVGLDGWRGYLQSITCILGVQGRYFIPLFGMLAVGCSDAYKIGKPLKRVAKTPILLGYYLVMMIHVISVLLERYWMMP